MISRTLGFVLCLLALAATALYLRLALAHLRYAGEMDYIEGVMLDHVVRLVEGKPLYVAPSPSFITLAYMPGYTLVASWMAKLLGVSFFTTRLLSLAASLAIAFLAGWIVRRETHDWVFGIAATGIYLMGYGIAGGGHYDVSRPDSLMLALSLAAYALLRFSGKQVSAAGAALLLVAAFFTKQHAVWFGLAALVHVALNDRRRLLAFGLPWVAGCAGGYAVLAKALGPWFAYYTWNLPSHWSTLAPLRIEHYVGAGLLGMLGALTVPAVVSFGLPVAPWRGREGLWAFLGLAGLGTGFLATLDPSAWRHVFIPSMVAFSVLGPLSLWRLAHAAGIGEPANRARGAAFALLILQFVPLIYSTHVFAPHPGAKEARERLIATVRAIPGRVIVVEHGFYGWLAGKGSGMQQIAFGDLERAPGDRLHRQDPKHLEHLLDRILTGPDRPTLITDEPLGQVGPVWPYAEKGYRMARDMGDTLQALSGFAGHAAWPRYVYAPVEPAAPAAAADTLPTGTMPARP